MRAGPRSGNEGERHVITRFFFSVLFAVITALVVRSLPDIARYLKIREM